MSKSMLHRLPRAAYREQAWFEREMDLIFSRTWRLAGFAEDIGEPGDFKAVQAGLNNILVVMDRDGQLRAFHNLCRHRGTQLLRSVGKVKQVITCPYHDWTYDLEGRLIAVPEEAAFGSLDKSCLGLKPASVALWRSMIFVHPDPNAGSLQDWFAPIEPHLGPHDVASLIELPGARKVYRFRANWKFVAENFIDVYHLKHLHAGTLHMYDHAKAVYGFHGPHFALREPLAPYYADDIENLAEMPLVLPKDRLGAWVPLLFPGLGLAESESSWSSFHIIPRAVDLTEVEIRTQVKAAAESEFKRQARRSASFWSKRIRGKYKAEDGMSEGDPLIGGDFMQEDIHVCEQQQRALASPLFETGPASVGESPILRHQEIVLAYLNGGQG